MGAEQGREGPGWARPGLSRPCPAPKRSIPEIFIKNSLYGHSSYLMTFIQF